MRILSSTILWGTGRASQVAVGRAYAHWGDQPAKTKQEVFELGIDPIEVWSYEKNAADMKLAIDAAEFVVYVPEIEVFAVVSGDGAFAALAKRLHDQNKIVVGCANEQATRYAPELRHGRGLPLASIAPLVRSHIKDLETSRRRWLARLLLSACNDAKVCLAKSQAHGEHRLFLRDCVPRDYEILDIPRAQPEFAPQSN